MRVWAGVAAVICLAHAGGSHAAVTASFTVTRTDDPAPDGCALSDCSLREAVLAVDGGSGGGTISIPAGHYRLTIAGPGEDVGATGDLDLTNDVTIDGAGARQTVIDSTGSDRVFDVASGVHARINDVSVTGGQVAGDGGGIRNRGTLALSQDAIVGDRAQGAGGGIDDEGNSTIADSLIADNRATDGGGLRAGASLVQTTTITGNAAGGPGATGHGGGIDGAGGVSLTLVSTTLTDNRSYNAALTGAGIADAQYASPLNTIIADNRAYAADQSTSRLGNCADPVSSGGFNLSDSTDCGLDQPGDQQGVAVALGPLADNGGGTDTEAVVPGSLALDSGGGCDETDQRGVTRPRGSACDVGAYEFAPPLATTQAASAVAFGTAMLNGTVDPSWHGATWYFEYGRTAQYGSRTPGQLVLGNGQTSVSAPLTGLRQGATYHFRLVASGDEGTTMGADQTFTTLDRTKPVLTLLRIVPGLFHRADGAAFAFTLTENATVTFRFDHSLRGVQRGKSCVKITRRNRRHRPCTRYVPVAGSVVLSGTEGQNSIHFDATVGAKLLTVGAYRLRAVPKDPSDNIGKTAVAAFRVLR
ncbi:MAG TPA: choice-of-anchor Q domain-containing protein [Gaiellaceae bacterium]|nr:choice-of-anchor Q domain-containing protein [Gaiellaceae bacterium]